MVTIPDTCKGHRETELTKRLSCRICYASLRGFCARRLVIWRPLSESFSSPFWYKRPEGAAFLIHASDICRIILPTCFTKCGSVNGWICPVLYSQAYSPCTQIHQISVLFCRFGRDILRALLVFRFIFFCLAHLEQKFHKIKGFCNRSKIWLNSFGWWYCTLHCFSVALSLHKNISAGRYFKYKSLRLCFKTTTASVPILAAHDPGCLKCCDNTLTAWVSGRKTLCLWKFIPWALDVEATSYQNENENANIWKRSSVLLCISYWWEQNVPSHPKCQSTFPAVKHEVVSTAMMQWDTQKRRKENGTVWLKNSKDVVCLRCKTIIVEKTSFVKSFGF